MGVVWAGRHRVHGTPVAIKVITDASAREERYRAAFRNEVRAVAGLSHPGVVRVHDYGLVEDTPGLVEGSPYLVMESLVPGPLAAAPDSFAALYDILCQLLDALAHAHARGVIHRDLKPDNVLRDAATNRLRITDFGLSQTFGREITQDELIADMGHATAGTPDYMAPEQARARAREQGPWSDLYSLGCMAFALATGAPPFVRSTPIATLFAHMTEPPPALVARFAVPAGLGAWIERMMAKSPQHRFRRAADARFALDRLAAGFESGPSAPPASQMLEEVGTQPTMELSEDLDFDLNGTTANLSASEVAMLEYTTPAIPARWQTALDLQAEVLPGTGLGLYGLRAVPFVGRAAERDRLWGALRAATTEGRGRAVLISGASGQGKSRLCEWLAERAHETGAAYVLRARSAAVDDAGSGFGPMWRRFFRAHGLEGDDLRAHLVWELTRLRFTEAEIAALQEAIFEILAPDDRSGTVVFTNQREAWYTMARVCERLSRERTVVLWMEDVQWSHGRLELVQLLLERQAEAPSRLLVLLTARSEALPGRPDEAARLAELARRPEVESLELGPLPAEERPRLIRALLGLDSALAHRVDARTAGNPAFAVQLVGDWVQRGVLEATPDGVRLRAGLSAETLPMPPDLQAVWGERVEQLLVGRSGEEAIALELAALLGLHVDFDEWAEVCRLRGLDPLPALASLADALLDAGLAERSLDEAQRGFTFVHGMFREAVESRATEAGPRWKALHHRACAEMLQARPGTQAADRRGRHALAAGDAAQAMEALEQAVRGRIATGEYDDAAELLTLHERARTQLGLPPEDPRHGLARARQAQIAHLRGDRDTALRLCVDNEMEARRFGWTGVLAEAMSLMGAVALDRGQYGQAQAWLDEGVSLAQEADDARLAGQCREMLGTVFMATGLAELAERTLKAARLELMRAGDEVGAGRASLSLARLMMKMARLDDALALEEAAYRHCEAAGSRNGMAACRNIAGEILRLRGRIEEAEVCYQEALAKWEAIGAGNAIFARANLGLVLAERGRYAEARPQLLAAVSRFEAMKLQAPLAVAHACLAPCAASAGDLPAFDAHVETAETILSRTGHADVDTARMLERGGELCAAAGEVERAQRAWKVAARQWRNLRQEERAAALEGRSVP